MEQIPDSDPENDLPELPISAIDRDLLRDMYMFFTSATRVRLREESRGSAFATLYEEIEQMPEPAAPERHAVDPEGPNGLGSPEAPERSEVPADVAMEPDQPAQNIQIIESAAHSPELVAAQAPKSAGEARSRSLRKRTFASRHPYIADQADWLGICTVDSINEMFDGDADTANVVRALNRLYLQKKKRYPDEDRYRSKSFYAHLGKGQLMALQGDKDQASQDVMDNPEDHESQDREFLESQDREPHDNDMEVDFDFLASQEQSQTEELIPYDVFDIPTHAPGNERSSNEDSESGQEEDESEESEREELIKVGGRYRKLSKILRGVLPESAKRLSWFQEGPKKRAKKAVREIVPRKGLAIRKKGVHSTQSEELAMELENDSESDTSAPTNFSLLNQSSVDRQYQQDYPPNSVYSSEQSHSLPKSWSDVSRWSTSPEPQGLDASGSDSDESVQSIDPRSVQIVPARNIQPPISGWFDGDEAEEADEIDNMFAPVPRKPGFKKNPWPRKPAGSGKQRHNAPVQRKLTGQRATTPKHAGYRTTGQKDVKRHTSRPGHPSHSAPRAQPRVVGVQKEKRPPKQSKLPAEILKPNHVKVSQPFKRGPVMATSVFEVESSDRFVRRPVLHSSVQSFLPTKEQLLSRPDVSLGHLFEPKQLDWISSSDRSELNIPQADSVSFYLAGKHFSFGLFHLEDSMKTTSKFLIMLRKTLSNPSSLIDSEMRAELSHAIKKLMEWLFICKVRPPDNFWGSVFGILKDFSKLQVREVRKHQFLFQSKMLLVFWVLIGLELRFTTEKEKQLLHSLDSYTADYWITFFQTFSSSDMSNACLTDSEYGLHDSLLIIFRVYEKRPGSWWPPITEALQEAVPLNGKMANLLDMTYILAAIVSRSHHNWSPFLGLLARSKDQLTSEFHQSFMEVCDLVNKKLSWPTEEKVLTQLYGTFAKRQFENFIDEQTVPHPIGFVSSSSHIPMTSAFDKFMILLYEHICDLGSLKDVKKLISKLLFSSQYHYKKERRNQIMFVNRLNLIVLLSQIPEVDLGSQLTNLVEQIKHSGDAFVYGSSLSALKVVCEVAKKDKKPLPLNAFPMLFSAFSAHAKIPEMSSIYSNFINFIGYLFQDTDSGSKCGVIQMFQILAKVDLDAIPNVPKVELLGILTVVVQQLAFTELDAKSVETLARFIKPLLRFLSQQMGVLPVSDVSLDSEIEETLEMTFQIWYGLSKLTNSSHWNIMMLQKYPYFGNSIARSRFIMFMCLEFLIGGENEDFVFTEIDKVLLAGLISPVLSKYSLDLYQALAQNPKSIFSSKREVSSLYGLQAYRLQIITRTIQNVASMNLHDEEKVIILNGFIKKMHEEYTSHSSQKEFADLCKRVVEALLKNARTYILENDEFWELSVKLGFPNKRVQTKWTNAGDHERVSILNAEFVTSLSYKTEFKSVLDKWIDQRNNHILYALIQVYSDATISSDVYWAHLSLLLEFAYEKLQEFRLSVRDSCFGKFLDFLPEIAHNSRIGKDSKYALFEFNALKHCLHILKYSYYVYQGYKDQEHFETVVEQFVARIYGPRVPGHTKPFTTHSISTLQSGLSVTFHPKYEHSPEEYTTAYQEYEGQLMDLKQLFQKSPHPALPDFDFSF